MFIFRQLFVIENECIVLSTNSWLLYNEFIPGMTTNLLLCGDYVVVVFWDSVICWL
jgi:hypothetical protein